jgi:hypothetical protein
MYRCHSCCYGICGRPRSLEEIEADLAGFEIHVGVTDGCYKADGGRREGVRIRDVNVEEPAAA